MIVVDARRSRPLHKPVWMITFTDLIALMLTFFVMLFATHKVERQPWQALIESMNRSLNPGRTSVVQQPRSERNARPLSRHHAYDLGYLESILRHKVESEPDLGGIGFRRLEDRLVLVLPADLLFDPASAVPTAGARRVLLGLSTILGHIGNRISVHGHADPVPLRNGPFRSNWELSIARATAVANELRRAGYHRDIDALGFADTRFAAPSGVEAADRRLATARRVDIVVHPTRGGE
jgi:chemotaxis protein MotB